LSKSWPQPADIFGKGGNDWIYCNLVLYFATKHVLENFWVG